MARQLLKIVPFPVIQKLMLILRTQDISVEMNSLDWSSSVLREETDLGIEAGSV